MKTIARRLIAKHFLCREKSSKVIKLSGYVFFISQLLFFSNNNVFSQWKRIADFSLEMGVVYFQHSEGHPEIGFAGSWIQESGNGDFQTKLYKTSDNGITWHNVADPSWSGAVRNILFKDTHNGWATIGEVSNAAILSGGCYKTTDGGETWAFLNGTSGHCSSVYYNKLNGLLLVNFWGQESLVSSDGGVTWQSIPNSYNVNRGGGSGNGFIFWDSLHGLISKVQGGQYDPFLVTSDGGITWQLSSLAEGAWQPLAIEGKTTAFCFAEDSRGNKFYRTDDYGSSWRLIRQFAPGESFSGCVAGNLQNLLMLTEGGMIASTDSGTTWFSICGPQHDYDVRFQFVGNSLIVPDNVGRIWLNTTGIGSNSTPQLTSTSKFFSGLGCDPKFDSLLTFTFFDSCNGIQAKLLSASLQGSNNFSFSSPSAIPRIIHPDDSLLISYNPQTSQPDTAALHLRFHLGWKDFDTTIQLFGAGRIPKESVQFIPTINSAAAGNAVDLLIKPDKNISAKGLQSITFDLIYNSDLLDEGNRFATTSIPGAVIREIPSPLPLSRREREVHVTITGTDLMLDPAKPICDIKFIAMVTDTIATNITMTNLQLNNGDQNFSNCILSADSSNTNFTLLPECGDSTLRQFLSTGKILAITSIHPNPSNGDYIVVSFGLSPTGEKPTLSMFDVLGREVYHQGILSGTSEVEIPIKNLSEGVYYVQLSSSSATVSQRFVKVQ